MIVHVHALDGVVTCIVLRLQESSWRCMHAWSEATFLRSYSQRFLAHHCHSDTLHVTTLLYPSCGYRHISKLSLLPIECKHVYIQSIDIVQVHACLNLSIQAHLKIYYYCHSFKLFFSLDQSIK